MITTFGPGRVNLIGEHTDYNGGLALPFAIDRGVTVEAEALAGGEIEVEARDAGESDVFPVDAPGRSEGWRAFVRGTVAELRASGVDVPGARLAISGNVPQGSGLSSSAALEAALCLALLGLAGAGEPDRIELARLCSRVENDWVGAETGLLDQLASLCSEPGQALRIDFATLELRPVPLELGDWQLVTLESGAEHSHATGGYNERRDECRRASEALGVATLSEADARAAARLPDPLDRRARHVLTENARVDAMVAALHAGDLEAAGRLLDGSHASLRDDYEASVPAVEDAVAALKRAGAAGARMVGGGFGGSVLALLPPGAELLPGADPGRSRAAGASALTAAPGSSALRRLVLDDLVAERTRERPREEERRGDQHRDADPQVEVPSRRLLDLRVGRAEAEDEQDHAVDQEQAADDAAQVEQVRGLAGARSASIVASSCFAMWGRRWGCLRT